MVEIYDTKFVKDLRAESLCANIISQHYELNAAKNPVIFGKLLCS